MHARPALVVLVALACSPAATPPPNPIGAQTANPLPQHPVAESAVRWSLEAGAGWIPAGKVAVDGGTLEVGPGGERWLQTATERKGAATLLPSDIVGATRDGNVIVLVTRDGIVYSSTDPLGAVTKVASPATAPIAAAVGKTAILVVDATGALSRSTDRGKTYAKVTLPPPADSVIVTLAMNGAVGLAIGFPQRLLVTKDDGASWSPVASPPGGGEWGVLVLDGALVLEATAGKHVFDPTTLTFPATTFTSTQPHPTGWGSVPASATEQLIEEVIRVVDGKRGLSVRGKPYSQNRDWSVSVGDLGAMPSPRVLDELAGCDGVTAAMRGDVVELACDGRGTLESIDKASAPYHQYSRWYPNSRRKTGPVPDAGGPSTGLITKLFRSEDGGKTFKEDGVLESGGGPRAGYDGLAIGSEGWVLLGTRCMGPSYGPTCAPPKVRTTATAAFAPATATPSFVRFATNASQNDVFAIGLDQDVPDSSGPFAAPLGSKMGSKPRQNAATALYRFKAGALDAEKLVDLPNSVEPDASSLTLEDDGRLRGFVRAADGPHAFEVKVQTKELITLDAPAPDTTRLAFGGTHAVAWAGRDAYETSNEGKTWSRVTWPGSEVQACSAWGCATGRGFRSGWAGTDVLAPEKPLKYVAAKPLKCSAQGGWTKLGGGGLASIEDVDVGAARWLLPTRDADGRVTVHVNKRGDSLTKTSDVGLTGPQLGPPSWGAETVMHVQPGGVLVRRFTYSRVRRRGEYNPVDAAVAWYRADTGKVFRASVSKIPAFRVNHDPQFNYGGPLEAHPSPPELLALDAKGVYFASPSYEDYDDKPLYLLRDDGRIDKLKTKHVEGNDAVPINVAGELGIVTTTNSAAVMQWVSRNKSSNWLLGAMGLQAGSGSLFDFGGRPALAQTALGLEPQRAWAIPIRIDDDPGEWFPLATQRSLGDVPRPCDAPPPTDGTAFQYYAPFVNGTRHAVSVDVDGRQVILATDRGAIRGSSKSPKDSACMSAMEAISQDDQADASYSALLFPDDLSHALLFMVNRPDSWPETISMRPMECAYTAGPVPEQLQRTPGFYEGRLPPDPHPHANSRPSMPRGFGVKGR